MWVVCISLVSFFNNIIFYNFFIYYSSISTNSCTYKPIFCYCINILYIKILCFCICVSTYKIVPVTWYCFSFKYHIKLDILIFGGISTAYVRNLDIPTLDNSLLFTHTIFSIFPLLLCFFHNKTLFSYIFRTNTMWYLQLHFLCHKLCISVIPLSLLPQPQKTFLNHTSNMCFFIQKKHHW